jgi:hypothetical protein
MGDRRALAARDRSRGRRRRLRIDLVRGGTVEGKVLTAPGREPAGVVVGLDRHDGKPRTQRVGPDGTFRFEHLSPGKYLVERVEEELHPGNLSTSWSSGGSTRTEYRTNCSAEDGGTTRFDVDLRDDAPCVLVAKVRVNGAPATGWTGTVTGEDRDHMRQTPGGASIRAASPIEVREPGSTGFAAASRHRETLAFTLPLELHCGENALPRRVRRRRGARDARRRPGDDPRFNSSSEGRIACDIWAKIGADGRFEMPYARGRGDRDWNDNRPDGSIVGPVTKVVRSTCRREGRPRSRCLARGRAALHVERLERRFLLRDEDAHLLAHAEAVERARRGRERELLPVVLLERCARTSVCRFDPRAPEHRRRLLVREVAATAGDALLELGRVRPFRIISGS